MIRELRDNRKTVLVSSHILTELAEMCDTVGIIERGQLLAVGSIEQILDQHRRQLAEQQTHRIVSCQVLGDPVSLGNWLTNRGDVDQIKIDKQLIHFHHAGDLEAAADLLKEMIQADFRLVAYGSRTESLEDVFLTVTKGRLQ
ncbi:MAG: ABC transporter ATP-binding protein, partial [Pirellulales bacterium]